MLPQTYIGKCKIEQTSVDIITSKVSLEFVLDSVTWYIRDMYVLKSVKCLTSLRTAFSFVKRTSAEEGARGMYTEQADLKSASDSVICSSHSSRIITFAYPCTSLTRCLLRAVKDARPGHYPERSRLGWWPDRALRMTQYPQALSEI